MTEAEWVACREPHPMMQVLSYRGSERRLRLLASACCRRVWDLIPDERSRRAVEVNERFADGEASDWKMKQARRLAKEVYDSLKPSPTSGHQQMAPWAVWSALRHGRPRRLGPISLTQAALWVPAALRALAMAAGNGTGENVHVAAEQCDLINDIFRNVLFPGGDLTSWRTPTVVALAEAAYRERALPVGTLDAPRLAVLADALEDAGCDDPRALAHLRGQDVSCHVRGCWVIDLLLGKE